MISYFYLTPPPFLGFANLLFGELVKLVSYPPSIFGFGFTASAASAFCIFISFSQLSTLFNFIILFFLFAVLVEMVVSLS